MESIHLNTSNHSQRAQLIDANLDRAKEGLRVIEDWCRFHLNNDEIIITLKDWRQRLGSLHLREYKFARDTSSDKGLGLTHPEQIRRKRSEEIVSANCARVQEALRVLEEFSRESDPLLAKTSQEIRYGLYELEIKILRSSIYLKRLNILNSCNLYLITSPHKQLKLIVKNALEEGVKMVQYRNKDIHDLQKLEEANELSHICKDFNALFIINDRIDIAIAVNADGVHLGQDDMPTSLAREIIGEDAIIGKSTHSFDQIRVASNECCDYLGIGPIYATGTKPNIQSLGVNYLKEVGSLTTLPWFAIGGINSSNLNEIKSTKAKRIAVVGAIMDSTDSRESTSQLIKKLK